MVPHFTKSPAGLLDAGAEVPQGQRDTYRTSLISCRSGSKSTTPSCFARQSSGADILTSQTLSEAEGAAGTPTTSQSTACACSSSALLLISGFAAGAEACLLLTAFLVTALLSLTLCQALQCQLTGPMWLKSFRAVSVGSNTTDSARQRSLILSEVGEHPICIDHHFVSGGYMSSSHGCGPLCSSWT